jgi:transcription initiation factor TFIIIB Brf1 subunit/transcription initiation factor TFIIB
MGIIQLKTFVLLTIKSFNMSLSPLQRINRTQRFNYERGICKESVNKVLRNILKLKYEKAHTSGT